MKAGQPVILARVRTQSGADAELAARVEALGPLARLAVLHTACEDGARALADRLAPRIAEPPLFTEATAVLGMPVAPGALVVVPVIK